MFDSVLVFLRSTNCICSNMNILVYTKLQEMIRSMKSKGLWTVSKDPDLPVDPYSPIRSSVTRLILKVLSTIVADDILNLTCYVSEKVRLYNSCELSDYQVDNSHEMSSLTFSEKICLACKQFTWNVKPYLRWKIAKSILDCCLLQVF